MHFFLHISSLRQTSSSSSIIPVETFSLATVHNQAYLAIRTSLIIIPAITDMVSMASVLVPQDTLSQRNSRRTPQTHRPQTHRDEDYRPVVVTARQCIRRVSMQTWYGTDSETCSMHETTLDCGLAALTSPCPTAREVSSNRSSIPTTPSSSNLPTPPLPTT